MRVGPPPACTLPKSPRCRFPKALPPFLRWAGGLSLPLSIALGLTVISTWALSQQQRLTYITLRGVPLKRSSFPSSLAQFRVVHFMIYSRQILERPDTWSTGLPSLTWGRIEVGLQPVLHPVFWLLAPEGLLRARCPQAPTSNLRPWRNPGHEGAPVWPGWFFKDVLVIGQFDTSWKTNNFRLN